MTFETSNVTIKNLPWDTSADIFLPPDFDEEKKYPAIVSTHPIGSCKEQTAGNVYGAALAKEGVVVAVFDASFQGASGGEPRSHYDLYDKPAPVGQALAKVIPFWKENL